MSSPAAPLPVQQVQSVAPAKKASALDPNSTRSKIEERLQTAVNNAPPAKNRSPELVPLTAEYEKMKKNLRTLVANVKKYSDATDQLNSSRDQLAEHLGLMSQETPIFDHVGLGLDPSSTEALNKLHDNPKSKGVSSIMDSRLETDSTSLLVLQKFATGQALCNSREFKAHVTIFAVEWEKAITERIDADLKHVRKLQGDRDHYEKKVEVLRRKTNDMESKGKASPASHTQKLERNEAKLKEAFILHETEAGRLCTMMEAATQDGWLELYSLVRNYMKWESNRVGRETDVYQKLAQTLDAMKATYKLVTSDTNSPKGGTAGKKAKGAKKVNGAKKAASKGTMAIVTAGASPTSKKGKNGVKKV